MVFDGAGKQLLQRRDRFFDVRPTVRGLEGKIPIFPVNNPAIADRHIVTRFQLINILEQRLIARQVIIREKTINGAEIDLSTNSGINQQRFDF